MRAQHIVPLAKQAVAILWELQPLTGPTGLVFSELRSLARPMSENTINAALRHLGYDINAMTDAFNRSLNALEDAGAIDARKLRKEYCTGSVWYELVARQKRHVAEYFSPQLETLCRPPRGE